MERPLAAASAPRPENARGVALHTITDVFGPHRRGAREAFDYRARHAKLDGRDRAFAMELAYGAIKMRRLLDWYLEPYLRDREKPLPSIIAEILRLGAHQLRVMRGVEAHAAVFESVGLARRFGHTGTAGLVNAVLRRLSEDTREPLPEQFERHHDYLGTRYSFPTWIVSLWESRFGSGEIEAMLQGANEPALISLRVDRLRLTRSAAIERLAGAGVQASLSPFVADAINLEHGAPDGFIEQFDDWRVQSESAAMPVDLLDPRPGEHVLELCAGRGNKTLALVWRMNDEGSIEAVEIDPRACEVARGALAAVGSRAATVIAGDGTVERERESVDAVLLDAPCSGLGLLGRHAEARWFKQPEDGARLAPLQSQLLDAAARAVRTGGRLVYSVCSTDERECESIVKPFLALNPAFVRAELPERYGPVRTELGDVLVAPGLGRRDGFYVAALQRIR